MAITVKHLFVSAKGDGSDATLVRPSNWNANHDIQLATSKIIGRLTAGPGTAEELPVTSYMIGLLNTADYATLAIALGLPTTGDAKLTFKATADVGWVLANDGSIGDVGSGATTSAATNTQALFTFFYNGFSDALVPLQTSAGAGTTRVAQGTAATAFGAKCRIVLPRTLGRALIVGGAAGTGLSARALGSIGGEENHVLTLAELASHTHGFAGSGSGSGSGTGSGSASVFGSFSGDTGTVSANHQHHISFGTGDSDRSLDHTHSYSQPVVPSSSTGGGAFGIVGTSTAANTGGSSLGYTSHAHGVNGDTGFFSANHTHGFSGSVSSSGSCSVTSISVGVNVTVSGTTNPTGSDAAHNNMQPWTAWNVMIRL